MSSTEIIVQEAQSQSAAAAHSILTAVERLVENPNVNMEALERMMDMQERILNRNAQVAFNGAMAQMQSELPSIAERAKGHNNKYATYEDINDVVKPIMQKFGFAMSFKVEFIKEGVSISGVLMHKEGHRETSTLILPSDTAGGKNAVQAVGSSISYGKRYVMSAMLNITTRGEDDDGYAAAPVSTVTDVQAGQLQALLAQCKDTTVSGFTSMYGDASLISRTDFDKVLAQLKKAAQRDQEA